MPKFTNSLYEVALFALIMRLMLVGFDEGLESLELKQ